MFRNRRNIERMLKYILGCGLFIVIIRLTILRVGEEDGSLPKHEELNKLMAEAEADNFKRLTRVTNTCRNYNLGPYKDPDKPAIFKHPPAPQYAVFYMIRSHNLSYCPIYKAGSTTWIYNLCLLMNVREDELNSGKEQISTIARRVIPELEYPEAEKGRHCSEDILR